MPKVSVILPNYNHAPYLKERIDSILNQTFQDFELIILDDLSTDNSRDIIEKYNSNPKISGIIYNEKNSGSTFKQWHKGVGLARGKYIWFAESDDWCEPSMLQTLVEGIESDKDCVVSYCQAYCIEGTNKMRFVSYHDYLSEIKNGDAFIKDFMIQRSAIFNASMAIWKKTVYEKISNQFQQFKLCGDWLFWMELANQGKVHISGKVLNYFRKHGSDVSGKMYQSGWGIIEELQVLQIVFKKGFISTNTYLLGLKRFIKAYYKTYIGFSTPVRQAFQKETDAILLNFPKRRTIAFYIYKSKIRYDLKRMLSSFRSDKKDTK